MRASTIALKDLGSWIFGSFSTLQEIKDALSNINIWAHVIPQLKKIPPLHLSFHDRSGKSLVVHTINLFTELEKIGSQEKKIPMIGANE